MTAVGPMRCRRCGGTGDVPIIQPDCFVVAPWYERLLQCCPDCAGTGYALRDEPPPDEEREAPRRARR